MTNNNKPDTNKYNEVIWKQDFLFSDEFLSFLNLVPEAALISDENGNIIIANHLSEEVFGYTKEEFKSLIIEDLVPEKVRDIHPKLRKMFFDDPKPRYVERRNLDLVAQRKNGEIFPMTSSLFAIHTHEGIYAVNLIRDITEQGNQQKKLESYAFVDSLTNLPNRRYFDTSLKQSLLGISAQNNLGILYVDVDKFKVINDNYGHDIGDLVLKLVAKNLHKVVRGDDLVARLGGDEFVIMIRPVRDHDYLYMIAQRILDLFAKNVILDGNELNISISIGITASKDNITAKDLVKKADKAMYEAKKTGGNTYYALFN